MSTIPVAPSATDGAGLSRFRDDLGPHEYGGFVTEWLRMGATHVGGCGGMEPAHIREMVALAS